MKARKSRQFKRASQPSTTSAQHDLMSRPLAPQPAPEPMAEPKLSYKETMAQLEQLRQAGHSVMEMRIDVGDSISPQPIQMQMQVGAPGDKYEQEADRVARQVVGWMHLPDVQQTTRGETVQQVDMPDEEDDVQMKAIAPLQRADMPEEDDDVQRKVIAPLQRADMPDEDEDVQMKEITPLQRADMPEEDDDVQRKATSSVDVEQQVPTAMQIQPLVQRRSGVSSTSADVEAEIDRARGSGQVLDPDLQQQMGRAIGADFSGVRVHTDGQSDKLNRSLQAKAFTTGQDVFFRQGAYQPEQRSGQELIAHELTHVVQQKPDLAKPTKQVSDEDPICSEQDLEPETSEIEETGTGAGEMTVQRKNLEQTGWVGGLTKEKDTRTIVGDGRKVNVYHDSSSIQASDKIDAFKKIAARSASIGKTTDDRAQTQWRIYQSNYKWTPDTRALNDNTVNFLDPFFYEGLAKWGDKSQGEEKYLGFMYQHAKNFTGYVESILDTSNPNAPRVSSMYDANTESALAGTETDDRNLKFSNIHDTSDNTNLLDMTGSGGAEKNLDAYTKIAGEGARWQCVRNHAAKLKNNSCFFTTCGIPGKVRAVTFKHLWLSWKDYFGKKYDITDNTVAYILANTNLGGEVQIRDLNDGDYDLDLSRGFETPFVCLQGNNTYSYFFTSSQNVGKVLSASAINLWMNWESIFNGAYNISNATVKNGILNNRSLRREVWFSQLDSNCFDLDLGRAFETPIKCLKKKANYFYTAHDNSNKVWYASRQDVLNNWITALGGQYGIDDSDVADAIYEEQIPANWLWKNKLDKTYYNLD